MIPLPLLSKLVLSYASDLLQTFSYNNIKKKKKKTYTTNFILVTGGRKGTHLSFSFYLSFLNDWGTNLPLVANFSRLIGSLYSFINNSIVKSTNSLVFSLKKITPLV